METELTRSVAPLRAAISGDVVTSEDPGWDAARQAWNLVADQHPAAVVLAEAERDIAQTVRFAAANGLRVAPQATGHGATTMGELTDVILLRTSRLTDVAVDPAQRTARVQAGARWEHVISHAGESGLTGLHGSSGGVGVAGYTLGGGLGWLARQEGLASARVRSFAVVTADGEQRQVDADHEPELFWALRGGGGGEAIVTSLEIDLVELREAFAGSLMWPIEQASEIVHAYREWIATVPDSLTSTVKLVRFPPFPNVPGPVRGKALVAVTLVFTGDDSEGDALVAPLREIATPYLDTLATVPATALGAIAGDPPGPLPGVGNGLLIDTFTAEAADAYVDLAGPDAQIALIHLELRHLGGALRDPPRDSGDQGVAGALEAEALIYGVGLPATPEIDTSIRATLAEVSERMRPWAAPRRTLLNFAEQDPGLRGSFPPEVADRLAGVTARYDPQRLFVANHERP